MKLANCKMKNLLADKPVSMSTSSVSTEELNKELSSDEEEGFLHHVPTEAELPPEIMRDRLRFGMCPMCGLRTYEVRDGLRWTGRHKVMIPITIHGMVLEGRCLYCYPLEKPQDVEKEIKEDSPTASIGSVESNGSATGQTTTHTSLSSDPPVTLLRDSKGRTFVGEVVLGTKEKGKGFFSHVYKEGGYKGMALVYEGEFSNGFFQGQGIYRGAGGDVYKGDFNRSAFDGQGKLTFSCGKVFDGSWKRGSRDGVGAMLWPNGDKYVGEWKNDRRNGHGQMSYCFGDTYEGNWKNDKRDGVGELRFENGGVQKGMWKDGVFVE